MKRTLVISLALTSVAFGQVDPKELVRQSIRNYDRDWRAAQTCLVYTLTDVTLVDGKKEVEVSEIFPLEGTPYERLITKNGQPLSIADRRKEERKYDHAAHQRQRESPGEREARIRKYENERSFINDIPEAYSFKLVGEETIEGRPAWVVTMTPRPGFTPATPHGAMLSHIEGKLWIDKEDIQWAKAEAHVVDTIGIGWIIARIEAGTRFSVEQTRVENGLWMPRKIDINGAAHVMMVHTKALNEQLSYSGYHRDGSVSAQKTSPPQALPAGAKSFR